MRYFNNDYNEACHPEILKALAKNAGTQMPGYSADAYCAEAAEMIRKKCDAPNAAVHFLMGGTQTNLTVIAASLRPHQGVIAAESGHINVHETGAIEATGHKVILVSSGDGKVDAALAAKIVASQSLSMDAEHIVQPKMVYISNPTEYGTLYSLAELKALYDLCRKKGLYLFVDGARLGYGLMAYDTDVTLQDIAELTDVFYIGGTKVGALFGEAVVVPRRKLNPGFVTLTKQQGAMLAKGRLLGIQFDTLFTDDLYFKISRHAIDMAMQLKKILTDAGCPLFFDSPSNQQFVVLTKEQEEALAGKVSYESWQELPDNKRAVRFCASWATKEEDLCALKEILAQIS